MTSSNSTQRVTRWLRWYDKRSGRLAGEKELVGIPLDELQVMFSASPDDLMYDCFRVEGTHVRRLERITGARIDFERFDYFAEAEAIES